MAVVVSAMSGETNKLVGWVREIAPLYDAREYDAVVSSGEQVTAGLMALTLQRLGVPARSWLGWQIGVETSGPHGAARIDRIETERLEAKFAEGLHAVVAGFQGVSTERRIDQVALAQQRQSRQRLAIRHRVRRNALKARAPAGRRPRRGDLRPQRLEQRGLARLGRAGLQRVEGRRRRRGGGWGRRVSHHGGRPPVQIGVGPGVGRRGRGGRAGAAEERPDHRRLRASACGA